MKVDYLVEQISPERKDASLNIGERYEIEEAFLGFPLEKTKIGG
jgi:hypothetical protein